MFMRQCAKLTKLTITTKFQQYFVESSRLLLSFLTNRFVLLPQLSLPLQCNNMERKIIHIDMDAFFASVEQRDNPELRGKPIAIGADVERGVVATASYEARPFGVHSAMSMRIAKRRCPELIVVPGRYHVYKEVSRQMHDIFHEYTDIIEPISLDEAFLDVTHNKPGIELAVDIAREIKTKIRERLHLTASAGVSYNKFLAKIASDQRKPDGLCTIHPSRAQEFIDALRIEKFWLVGPKTAQTMHRMGIFTGADLREVSLKHLTDVFGKMGPVFYNFARGIDDRPVVVDHERKSMGCEHTFEHDLYKRGAVLIELNNTVNELVRRLEKYDFEGHTLTLKVKFHDFRQITRSITHDKVLRTKDDILPLSKQLLSQVDYRDHPIRLLGLSVTKSMNKETSPTVNHWVELEIPFSDW